MNEFSKRRNQAIKIVKSKLPVLPIESVERLAKVSNDWKFPEQVANMPTNTEEEAQKLLLCFDYLNWKTCLFTQFDDTKARALMAIFEKVSKCEVNKFPELRLVRDSIKPTSPYESLFVGLSPDVDMKETDLPGDSRIFFFLENVRFNIVSIETKHRNIDN